MCIKIKKPLVIQELEAWQDLLGECLPSPNLLVHPWGGLLIHISHDSLMVSLSSIINLMCNALTSIPCSSRLNPPGCCLPVAVALVLVLVELHGVWATRQHKDGTSLSCHSA